MGPARRMYDITRAGMEELHTSALALRSTVDLLGTFLSRYGEFVALPTPGAAATPTRR